MPCEEPPRPEHSEHGVEHTKARLISVRLALAATAENSLQQHRTYSVMSGASLCEELREAKSGWFRDVVIDQWLGPGPSTDGCSLVG